MNEFERVEALADRVARFRISVLIVGETGAGKDVLAQRIHRRSQRAIGPLVAVDCAALCPTLAESALFGHERGAFTGAVQAKPGLLETANGGTVFLDELGDLPLTLQAKLLRALETRTIQRVGSTDSRQLDVRFLAATNVDLDQRVVEGRFRADLLFRLDGIRLTLPPLRARRHEIARLAREFLREASEREEVAVPSLAQGAVDALMLHSWPGNVRELRNVVERALALSDGRTVEPEHLLIAPAIGLPVSSENAGPGDCRRQRIVSALHQCAGNQTRAAQVLGISRRTLVDRLDALDLPRPRKSIPRPSLDPEPVVWP